MSQEHKPAAAADNPNSRQLDAPFAANAETPDPANLDEPITLRQLGEIAAHDLGRPKPIHVQTIRTWCGRKGKRGVVLQTFMQLGCRMTTRRMYEDFKRRFNEKWKEWNKELQGRAEAARLAREQYLADLNSKRNQAG